MRKMVKGHIRTIYIASGLSPSGEGWFKKVISKKDIDFYYVRGSKISKKRVRVRSHRRK